MLAKILIPFLILTVVAGLPLDQASENEDLPVYTEKVMQAKPTAPGKKVTRIPRFQSKKLSSLPKKSLESIPSSDSGVSYTPPKPSPAVHQTAEPVRTARKTPSYADRNPVVEDRYTQQHFQPALTDDNVAPRPSYSEASHLGVEYAPEVISNNYQPEPVDRLVNDYVPRKFVPKDVYGSAGNEPELRYAPAPQRINAAAVGDYEYGNNYHEEKAQPYIFGYELKDENGATQNRKEQGDDYGNKRGSYGYTDEHGIYRQVDYVADAHGFRAVIKTNEPGTENQNPADVEIHSDAVKY